MYKHTARGKHRHIDYDLLADLERIKSAIAEAASDVKGKAGDVINQSLNNMKERSVDLTEGLGDFAKQRPVKTIGVAILTGLIIGYFLPRK